MGAIKNMAIEMGIEEINDNLLLFENDTFQMFNVNPEKKLTPVRDILAEMKLAFEKKFSNSLSSTS